MQGLFLALLMGVTAVAAVFIATDSATSGWGRTAPTHECNVAVFNEGAQVRTYAFSSPSDRSASDYDSGEWRIESDCRPAK